MISRIVIFILCVLALCATVFFFGTPEQNAIMFSVLSKINEVAEKYLMSTSIVSVLMMTAFISVMYFFHVIRLRKNKEIRFENYVLKTNLLALLAGTAVLHLMVIAILGIPSFVLFILEFLAIFLSLVLSFTKKMFLELDALKCMILLDPFTRETRVYFKGFHFISMFAKEQALIDMKADILSEITEDVPTSDVGTLVVAKIAVISKPYFGKDTDPIEDRSRKAMDFVKYEKTIKPEQEVFAKKLLSDFCKGHTLADCTKAKASDIFPPNSFDYLEGKFPIKFSEPTVYDLQPSEETLKQQMELRETDNFITIIEKLTKDKLMTKKEALAMAPFLAKIDYKKTIDDNNYNIKLTGLPKDLSKLLTPEVVASLAAAYTAKAKTGKRPRTNSSQQKK